MTREEAIQWLKVINTKEFGWDEYALQESQMEIRERCEQGVREAVDMAIEALSAEVVQGEWVRKVKEYNDCDGHRFVYWYECDQCGARPPKDTWNNEWHSNFCPSCGARMENKE